MKRVTESSGHREPLTIAQVVLRAVACCWVLLILALSVLSAFDFHSLGGRLINPSVRSLLVKVSEAVKAATYRDYIWK